MILNKTMKVVIQSKVMWFVLKVLKKKIDFYGYDISMLVTETGIKPLGEEIFYYQIDGEEAANFQDIIHENTNYYPVILSESFEEWFPKDFEYRTEPQEIIKKALDLNPKKFLDERLKKIYKNYTKRENKIPRGPWIEGTGGFRKLNVVFEDPYNRNLKYKNSVDIVLIPTIEPWQIFAILPFGGWNDCPFDHEHAAIWKWWGEKYKTYPVAIKKYATIEAFCKKPIETKEEALKLSIETFKYCEDIVYQGSRSVDVLASERIHSTTWFFWWD